MNPWYKNAVIYSLDVRTFQDSDGDGLGDFDGLSSRLDYLSGLGITAVWVLPFFPSPMADWGYDVTDYLDVDDQLGGMAAFVRFMRLAEEHGIRVIVDLPLNHTSTEHPWFQEARQNPDSKYRDYYIWTNEPPPDSPEQIVFRGDTPTPWTHDEAAGQYYLHRFYESQPDLNHGNPEVRKEILKIIEFWLSLGASGIRVDAAPYIAKKSASDPEESGPHPFLQEMHRAAIQIRPDALLMAEADVPPAELQNFFGTHDGGEMQMLFDFLLNNYFFLALARQEAEPLVKALGMLPNKPKAAQWANWVRNHDELDLERLSTRERDDVLATFAPEESMQIYGRGIRRRFPPMVGGDQRRIELAYALLFALPGTPIIRYGEEIGMGDDLSLPERESVRTVMQWSPHRNGGFSTCSEDQLQMPLVDEGDFGFERVNAVEQQLDRNSLLALMHVLITVRRQHPEIGIDKPDTVETNDPSLFALEYRTDTDETIVLYNLSGDDKKCLLPQLEGREYLYDVLANRPYEPPTDDGWQVSVDGFGYRWFKVTSLEQATDPSVKAARRAMQDKPR